MKHVLTIMTLTLMIPLSLAIKSDPSAPVSIKTVESWYNCGSDLEKALISGANFNFNSSKDCSTLKAITN